MSDTAQQLQILVHRAVADLTSPRLDAREVAAVDFAAVTATVGSHTELLQSSSRWRWRAHEAARLAAAYLAWLQPPAGWLRLADDALGQDGDHLVWSDGELFFAEVLATSGRGAALWTRHTSGLPRRLVRAGTQRFGDAFAGVRLTCPSAPAASLVVIDPTSPPTPVTGSALWFHPVGPEPRLLAAAAAGKEQA